MPQKRAGGRLGRYCLIAIPAGAMLGGSGPACADAAGSDQLGEIVVTATRHEESLSKVPISVSAYSQEMLDSKGVKDFGDLVKFTPGVTIDANQTNSISIRGIASSGGAGTTGIYIDDTPIQMRAIGFNPDDTLPKTFDLDRVEVLRGPQGTLFGAGSEGGTVRYILPPPSLTTLSSYGKTELSYTQGGAPSYEAGIAAGGPAIDGVLGFRASAWYRRDGGWIDQIEPTSLQTIEKNANHDETVLLRLAATWKPADNLTIAPSLIYQDRQRNNISIYWPIHSNPGGDRYQSADPNATREPDRYWLPMLKIEAEFGAVKLISNTSMFRRNDLSGYEGTLYNLAYYQTLGFGNNDPALNFVNPALYPLLDANGIHLPPGLANYRAPADVMNRQDNFTQELRLQSNDASSRVTWTAGLFFQINKEQSTEEIRDPMSDQLFTRLFGTTAAAAFGQYSPDGITPIPLLPNGDIYANNVLSHDRQIALFAESNLALTDRLKLIVGARYSKTDYTFSQLADGAQNGGLSSGSGEQSEKPFTPKLGLSYQMDSNNLFYATYAKGFRIGGANVPIPAASLGICGLTAEPAPYHSDSTQSYEIGAKNRLFDSLRLASSIYYIKWNEIQQNIYIPNCGFQYTANLGSAIAKGFDLQADWAISEALSLESAIGYTEARYNASVSNADPVAPQNVVTNGDAITGESGIPGAPWTATLGLQYGFTLAARRSFVRIDYEWQSQNHWLYPATDPTTTQYNPYSYAPSSTTFVSLRAGSKFGDWSAEFFIDNLLDTHTTTNFLLSQLDGYNPAGSPAPLVRDFTYRPRTFGLTFIYRH